MHNATFHFLCCDLTSNIYEIATNGHLILASVSKIGFEQTVRSKCDYIKQLKYIPPLLPRCLYTNWR